MDKKNTFIGSALLVAAFVVFFVAQHFAPPPPPAPVVVPPPASAPAATAQANSTNPSVPMPADAAFAAIAKDSSEATITTLSNGFIEVRLTDFGGAINQVAFKKYAAELGRGDPFVFNQPHVDPILAFTEDSFPGLSRTARYQLVSATPSEVVYRLVLENKIEVTRRYVLRAASETGHDDPAVYVVRHETTFRNLSNGATALPRAALSLGTASLVSANDAGQYLNVASYDGSSTQVTDRRDLEGAGAIGRMMGRDPAPKAFVEKSGTVVWAAVKNQFFASIFAADKPGQAVITRRIDPNALPPFPGTQRPNAGLTGAERFDLPTLPPGGSGTLAGDLYIGPKEYPRLARLAHNEDGVMQYGTLYGRIFLSVYVAPFMNSLMHGTQRWVGNWGLAIVLMTLIIKTVSLPFTLAASRSAKRMQKFQPQIAALKEKFKDNPQKLNQATLELFKQHKINPMGGCLPMLITMPLFIGFYTMLQGSAELRFQTFLWAKDLSTPDTVAQLFGFPLNIMPLLMGATMLYQMRLTPQPTADNAQVKMMKFMPILFMFFCYSLSCALSIYMTINGLFTICQQLVINRMKDNEPETVPGTAGMKNVTPSKKKPRK
jgi:YidC/Oxa1 family membrane protein insertase